MMFLRSLLYLAISFFIGTTDVRAAMSVPVGRRPNILVIVIDTLRSDHLGCYGYTRPTSPNIDRLASEGVLFEQCYSVASWTYPSFISMFTGLLPAAHGCVMATEMLPETIPTFPEQLKKRGYFCGAVVSNPILNGKLGFARGFDHYDDYSVFVEVELGLFTDEQGQNRGGVNDIVTGQIVTEQAKLLMDKASKSGNPFFLMVVYFDPHDSYVPPPPYSRFDPNYRGRLDGRGLPYIRHNPPTGDDLEHLKALYDGEILYTDHQIGKLLAKLDETSDKSNTFVILISDHGEAFGEHGKLLHGRSAYREELLTPMIWRWTGVIAAGHRVKEPVATIDLTATLQELFHFDDLDSLQGQSQPPEARPSEGTPPEALAIEGHFSNRPILSQRAIGADHHVALTRENFRLHARFIKEPLEEGAEFELFDILKDPTEQRNIKERHPLVVTNMRENDPHDLVRVASNPQQIPSNVKANACNTQ